MAVWWVCIGYVVLLALNAFRIGLLVEGVTRLALWTVMVVLFIRARRATPPTAAIGHAPR